MAFDIAIDGDEEFSRRRRPVDRRADNAEMRAKLSEFEPPVANRQPPADGC